MLSKHIAPNPEDYHLGAVLFRDGCTFAQCIGPSEHDGWMAAAAGARRIALTDAAAAELADADTEAYLRRQDDCENDDDWRYPNLFDTH